jgi:hypothetical protein
MRGKERSSAPRKALPIIMRFSAARRFSPNERKSRTAPLDVKGLRHPTLNFESNSSLGCATRHGSSGRYGKMTGSIRSSLTSRLVIHRKREFSASRYS